MHTESSIDINATSSKAIEIYLYKNADLSLSYVPEILENIV